jgi:hypothetical protein
MKRGVLKTDVGLHVDRDGALHVRQAGARLDQDALLQVRRYRQYHLSWRQLRTASRLSSRRQLSAVIRQSRIHTGPVTRDRGVGEAGGQEGAGRFGTVGCDGTRLYTARSCVVDLEDGEKRPVAYASLMHVVEAHLSYAHAAGALRILDHTRLGPTV